MAYLGGSTNHAAAINTCQTTLKSNGRENVIVLLTDGKPNDEAAGLQAADEVRVKGSVILPVYVRSRGNPAETQAAVDYMKKIGSYGSYINVANFDKLDEQLDKVAQGVCEPPPLPCKTAAKFDVCIVLDKSSSICGPGCSTQGAQTCPSTCADSGVNTKSCCNNFLSMKRFALQLVNKFELWYGANGNKYAIKEFSTIATGEAALESDKTKIFEDINGATFTGGENDDTDIEKVIDSCQSTLGTTAGREQLIVLLTDGMATQPTPNPTAEANARAAATDAKNAGTFIVPVHLISGGNSDKQEVFMNDLGSGGSYTKVSNIDQLYLQVDNVITEMACNAVATPPRI